MFKKLCLTAGLVALVAFAGCNSLPAIQEQFAAGCGIVNGELSVLSGSQLLSADQQAKVKTILSKNQSICAAGAQLNVADLKDFHDSLLPAVVTIVEAFPALPNQQEILLGLQAFGPIVQSMVDQIVTVVTVPASAPVAASQ